MLLNKIETNLLHLVYRLLEGSKSLVLGDHRIFSRFIAFGGARHDSAVSEHSDDGIYDPVAPSAVWYLPSACHVSDGCGLLSDEIF